MPDDAVLVDDHLTVLAAQRTEVRRFAATDRAWRVVAELSGARS
jgi:hypothetical protein